MTKQELIEKALNVARSTHERSMYKEDMEAAYASLCEVMEKELMAGGEVPLKGMGKLKARRVSARKARNPKTLEVIEIPPCTRVVFAPAKNFREAVKNAGN